MQDFVDNKGFLYKFDKSQGYHHIDIDKNHQKSPSVYALHHLFLPRLCTAL